MSHGGRKAADETLLLALASGQTVRAAAEANGVSERTVHRRLDDPDFQARIRQTRRDMYERTVGKLAAANVAAVTTLVMLLKDGSGAVRLGASKALIELSLATRREFEIEQRLDAVERELAERKAEGVT